MRDERVAQERPRSSSRLGSLVRDGVRGVVERLVADLVWALLTVAVAAVSANHLDLLLQAGAFFAPLFDEGLSQLLEAAIRLAGLIGDLIGDMVRELTERFWRIL